MKKNASANEAKARLLHARDTCTLENEHMIEERPQTLGEEIANSVSHGVALLAALVGAPFLLVSASQLSATNIVGAAVFAATMVLLYFTSTLYHALPAGRAKRRISPLPGGGF